VIRVVLADDHALVRAGIRALLERSSAIEVVAEADDGQRVLEEVVTHHPDVVLLDISMPRLNGLEAARRLTKKHPEVQVIMLSMHVLEEYVSQALRAGVSGYLSKNATAAELEQAIQIVAQGGLYLSPAVSKHITTVYRRHMEEESLFDGLTPRQREVLQLIAEGAHHQEDCVGVECQ
jgi:DNA-binding NarL/FixJ family response regulator